MHTNGPRRLSRYCVHFTAVRILRDAYGISAHQFRRACLESIKKKGDSGEHLIASLESRLDAVIHRMNFVKTCREARQRVGHGHVRVNGKRVDIPSYRVFPGDFIEIRDNVHNLAKDALESNKREIPDYCEVDKEKVCGKFLRYPAFVDVPYCVPVKIQQIVEFYSR